MNAPPDRNLLFGVLALQMDFVQQDQLVAGMQAWVADKAAPLAEHLERLGALSPAHRRLLEPLVEAHIRQHKGDPQKSLESLSSIGSLREALQQIPDPQLHATLSFVPHGRSVPPDDPYATLAAPVAPASPGARFRILRPHAEGGLGQVFLARDEEVGRDVALKEIKARWADHPGSRARFLREAEITGGLEHPGIVPVYGLGAYADGRPFYAMRFIRGTSLKEAIEAFNRREGLSSTERNLELRRLLQRLIDVCEAIDYAHSRGVLHRDLKPGNIMLGRYGETLVVDWGLAKALGKSPVEQAEFDAAALPEVPLVPASGDSEPTRMGSAIGTPAFMSPEQAQGQLHALGPASDVFSLGATLYQLLTGVPPYSGEEMLRRAQLAQYDRPRAIRPEIPRPLEAICLKSMAPAPRERYASARELADEIERWLAGEPVAAYPERPLERASRWARKHRAWFTAGALALTLITAISTIAFVIVSFQNWRIASLADAERDARQLADRKRTEAEKARDGQAKARQEAELARNQTRRDRKLLVEIIDQLGEDVYRHRRHRPLLESGVANYREFLAQDENAIGDDPLLRARFAGNLATLLEGLDDYVGAKRSYDSSIAQYEALLTAGIYPDLRRARSELGSTYGNLAGMHLQTGETADALDALGKAIGIQQELVDGFPDSRDDRRELARHTFNRGYIRAVHEMPGAIEDLQAAVNLQQPLVESDPQIPELRMELGVMQIELGTRLAHQAQAAGALAGLLNIAARQKAQQDLRQSRELIEAGVTALAALLMQNSQNSEYRKELADGQAELGQALALEGKLAEAEASLEKSIAGFTALLVDFPADPDFQRGLALARFSLGLVKDLGGHADASQESYRAAAAIQEQLIKTYPDRALYWTDCAKTWTNLASVQLKNKQLEEALRSVQTAVERFRHAWGLAEHDEQMRPAVYQAYVGLAQIAIAAGDHAALAELGESHAALLPDSAQDLFDAAKLTALAVPLVAKDAGLADEARGETAEKYARRAVEFLRRARERGLRDAQAVRSEPDLAPLRMRPDFQELLKSMEGA